ncbi:ribosomal RNA small subunit methyltransferase NEP1-like [Oppia nitens]|uniref:ribosomal RNA small subunit methyltransferase NEP1-like n=1 Tax=Oppia nitens TaxID=1686743 RepID=UPI0023DCC5C5|nr:ribosomal RNA small subunit methyltransferase NEP1-like [Oppia nitens]
MSEKRPLSDEEVDDTDEEHDIPDALTGSVVPKDKLFRPKLFKNSKDSSKRLIVILEKCNLEIVKTFKNFELLNCDQHMSQIRKYKKDPAFCRPDITHQCLLMLFDSPLNRAGLLQVYMHTDRNVLIEISPQTRFPRTFTRFANLMVQLLHKLSIRSSNGPQKLLKVIKNPITSHLPVGCKKYGTSFKADKVIHPRELVPSDDSPVAIVIGAMAHGMVDADYMEESVSISEYPLSAALAATKICSAFEEVWNIH